MKCDQSFMFSSTRAILVLLPSTFCISFFFSFSFWIKNKEFIVEKEDYS